MSSPSPALRRTRAVRPDAACVEAVDLAETALAESVDPTEVGEHLGYQVEGERVLTHWFACTSPGYVGWRWSVTVARASRSKQVTVDEIVLLPGPGALLAPAWVPWAERVRPGDMSPGTLLPTAPDDIRLVPVQADVDHARDDTDDRAGSDDADDLDGPSGRYGTDGTDGTDGSGGSGADEAIGLAERHIESAHLADLELAAGRARVLSREGRDEAAERWYTGSGGPEDPVALAAPAHCSTCGFLVRLSSDLGTLFGVCANEYSPSDGQVVSFDHGCGAHSEVISVDVSEPSDEPNPVFDTLGYDDVD